MPEPRRQDVGGPLHGDAWLTPARLRARLRHLFAPYRGADPDFLAELGQDFAVAVLEWRQAHGGQPPRALGRLLDRVARDLERSRRSLTFRGPACWPVDLTDLVAAGELAEQIAATVASLPQQRQRTVISRRFGLGGGDAETLDRIGRDFGLTRERIRAIEAKALRLLRHPTRSTPLRPYVGLPETPAPPPPARLPSVAQCAAAARRARAQAAPSEPPAAIAPPPQPSPSTPRLQVRTSRAPAVPTPLRDPRPDPNVIVRLFATQPDLIGACQYCRGHGAEYLDARGQAICRRCVSAAAWATAGRSA